jgi:serine/threonine protein phosphatase PrpC
MRFAVARSSVRGLAHVDQQLPNQDAVLLRGQRGGWVAAVCDGLGSAKQSDIGSKAAALAVRQVLKSVDKADASLINANIHARWRDQTATYRARDVATTCLWLSVQPDGNATFGQLGDGLILFRQGGRFYQLTPPRQGYGNQTQALYEMHAAAQWQQATCTLSEPGDGVVLMTDGISDDLVPDALDGFYQAMFNNVRARSRRNAQRWLGRELEQWSTPMHGDDKSLVAIFKTS